MTSITLFPSRERARRGAVALAALFVATASACSTADMLRSRPRAIGSISAPRRTMSAMIDGKEWKADWVQGGVTPAGLQILTSMDGGSPALRAISMTFSRRRTGRQSLGLSSTSRAILHVGSPEITWNTFGESGSGEVVILTASSTRITGTFQFTAMALVFEPDRRPRERVVTRGKFDLEF